VNAFDAWPSHAEITEIGTSCKCISVPHVCRASWNRMWRTRGVLDEVLAEPEPCRRDLKRARIVVDVTPAQAGHLAGAQASKRKLPRDRVPIALDVFEDRLAKVRLKHVFPVTGPIQLPSRHRLGPRDMPFEAKCFRHVAVVIPEVRVSRGVAVSPRDEGPQPQQPDVADNYTIVCRCRR
jgi:hypothetical protein